MMAEYIDQEAVKEIMQKYRCSDCTNDKSLDCPLCQLHRPFAEISKNPQPMLYKIANGTPNQKSWKLAQKGCVHPEDYRTNYGFGDCGEYEKKNGCRGPRGLTSILIEEENNNA